MTQEISNTLGGGETEKGKQPSPLPRGRLERITDWESVVVHACYSSSALAQVCGVSLRHLQRHIRAAHHQNLGEWLNTLRLEHAYLKLSKGMTVKETAYSLGFKQVSHFSRLFKKKYGTPPSTIPITVTTPAQEILANSKQALPHPPASNQDQPQPFSI